jgi:hypothetical protein
MHVVFGLKLEKVVNKLSFEQNVKNHHKFWLLQNYTNNIHWKFSQKTISWIRLARKSSDPTIQLCKHTKPYIIIQEWNINYFVSFNKLMKKIFQCFDLISQSNYRNPSFERFWESVRMKTHTPKWAPMLGVGIPVDSRTFRERLQRSKHLTLGNYLYHWKAMEVCMSKMSSHDPFGHF